MPPQVGALIFGPAWYAWALALGLKAEGRDISWVESVTLELAILILMNENFYDCSVII